MLQLLALVLLIGNAAAREMLLNHIQIKESLLFLCVSATKGR